MTMISLRMLIVRDASTTPGNHKRKYSHHAHTGHAPCRVVEQLSQQMVHFGRSCKGWRS